MRLQKLEMFGFKSFADPTSIHFKPGVTALVGPNGCGKSNIVDAIKWVLGDMSPKSLRSEELSDCIFNGTVTRKPAAFADVSLTISNEQRVLPVDFNEVVITRRVYRSGEGEYFINKSPCRLKDIRELFMDTGIGTSSYSIIEQGRVDMLLQSNPRERRTILEEAAGISKYKSKRLETERRLERVEANLIRLKDVLGEVQRQQRSVQRQASIARRYREHSGNLKTLKMVLAGRRHGELSRLLDEARSVMAAAEQKLAALTGQREAARAAGRALEEDSGRIETLTRRIQDEALALKASLEQLDQRATFCRERVVEIKAAGEKREIDRRTLREDLLRITDEARRVNAEREVQESAWRAYQEETARLAADIVAAVAVIREVEVAIENGRAEVYELAQKETEYRNLLSDYGRDRGILESQKKRLTERHAEINTEKDGIIARRNVIEADRCRIAGRLVAATGELEGRRREGESAKAEMERVRGALLDETSRLTFMESRLAILKELENVDRGTAGTLRRILGENRPGIRGLVADIVSVEPACVRVVERLLGEDARALVVDDAAVAEAVLGECAGEAGEVSLLVLADAPAVEPLSVEALPGATGRLLDGVRAIPGCEQALETLLGDVWRVPDLATARRLARENSTRRLRFVTSAGHIVERSGVIRAGARAEGDFGLIGRRHAMATLGEDIGRVRTARQELQGRLDGLIHQSGEAERTGGALNQEIARLQIEEAGDAKEISQLGEWLGRLEDEHRANRLEDSLLGSEIENLVKRAGEAEASLKDRLAASEAARSNVRAKEEELKGRYSQWETLRQREGEVQVALAEARERRESLDKTILSLDKERQEKEARETALAAEAAGDAGRMVDLEAKLAEADQERIRIRMEEEAKRAEEERLAAEREALVKRREAHEAETRRVEDEAREIEVRLQDARVAESGHAINLQNLVDRVRDEYGVALPFSPEEATRYAQELRPDEELIRLAEELQEKIRRLGPVNIEALNEEEALNARAEYLVNQEADLQNAKKSMAEMIQRLNNESRERFRVCFEEVRAHFQSVFRKLFGGGKAEMILEEGVDILEAGIEIIAKPPGKEPASISQLSGGEKALAAVSLLFAIFESRPSPFCILDEADAPLDEANVGRFSSILREFLARSQFIVITHNKATMSMADILYGVTMQEPGVSTQVVVEFEKVEKVA
ncbi:MAG: chromosome segregation protein SMC [Planctomycetota bacterium]